MVSAEDDARQRQRADDQSCIFSIDEQAVTNDSEDLNLSLQRVCP